MEVVNDDMVMVGYLLVTLVRWLVTQLIVDDRRRLHLINLPSPPTTLLPGPTPGPTQKVQGVYSSDSKPERNIGLRYFASYNCTYTIVPMSTMQVGACFFFKYDMIFFP